MTTYFVTKENAKTADEARAKVEETLWDYSIMFIEIKRVRGWFRFAGWNVSFVVLGV